VDSTTQALMRFRQGGFVQHPEDYVDEPSEPRKREYYGWYNKSIIGIDVTIT